MLYESFYDPEKSYEENFEKGPFGAFADGKVFENAGRPEYDFFGRPVFSPFGIPAGPLINGKFCRAALNKGFDIVTYKTVRSGKYPSHRWPNVLSVKVDGDLTLEKAAGKLTAGRDYSEPLSITNSFGVPSFEPEFWQKDIAELVKYAEQGQAVVGAFQGTKKEGLGKEAYIDDFRKTARLLKETGVKAIEVNFSCPNEGTSALLCYDTARSAEVAKAIKEEIGEIPLIVKVGYFKDDAELENFVKEIGAVAQGIAAINTIPAEIVDEKGNQALPGEGRQKSGVCGHAIKWAGLDMVRRLASLREKLDYSYKIIGVGGVTSSADFAEYRKIGADFVMSATGAMWNPYLAQEVKTSFQNG
jgi:dihydroorotate dehydrogenase (NAD+) catalytic subunit